MVRYWSASGPLVVLVVALVVAPGGHNTTFAGSRQGIAAAEPRFPDLPLRLAEGQG